MYPIPALTEWWAPVYQLSGVCVVYIVGVPPVCID